MMKSWQLSLDSTAELLERFEAAKERGELIKRLYEQKKEKIQSSTLTYNAPFAHCSLNPSNSF